MQVSEGRNYILLNPESSEASSTEQGMEQVPFTVAYLGIFKSMHTKHGDSNKNNNHS